MTLNCSCPPTYCTSIMTMTVFDAYTTISGMADQASNDIEKYEVCSPEWYKAVAVSESLREAAIQLISDINKDMRNELEVINQVNV